jgi:hypothetical protein
VSGKIIGLCPQFEILQNKRTRKKFWQKLKKLVLGKFIAESNDFQVISSLLDLQAEQFSDITIDSCLELKRNNGTEFTIWSNNVKK